MTEMKIVHLTWTLTVGGAEEMLVDIVNQQCRTERVFIVVINNVVDAQVRARIDPRVKLFFLNRKPGSRGMKPLFCLNWLIHLIRPSIIHVHTWSLVKLLPFCRYKIVLTVHTTKDVEAFDESVMRYHTVFAISQAVANEVRERINNVRLIKVVNGVRPSDIRFNIPAMHSLFRIVQVARLEHSCKGQDVLLRALARVCDQVGDSGISLDFVGDGPSRQLLEHMAKDLGLNKSVTFRGAVPRPILYNELCTYDLLVQSSRFEGFGLAVVEAMVAGIPVLVSDLEGLSGIIEGGRFGFLFQPDDDADCARAIQHIRKMRIHESSNLIQRLQAARAHALDEYDVNRTANEYLLAYRGLLSVAAGRAA